MNDDIFGRYARHVEFVGDKLDDVNRRGVFDSQIIHLASFKGSVQDVAKALSLGADVNAIGDLGLTPLHYAVLGGAADVISVLVDAGGDLNAENEFGETPVQMAHLMGAPEIECLLYELGASRQFGFDGADTAKARWVDFKVIQEKNFLSNY